MRLITVLGWVAAAGSLGWAEPPVAKPVDRDRVEAEATSQASEADRRFKAGDYAGAALTGGRPRPRGRRPSRPGRRAPPPEPPRRRRPARRPSRRPGPGAERPRPTGVLLARLRPRRAGDRLPRPRRRSGRRRPRG